MKAIQANPKPIANILNEQYIIPDFQRPYSWGAEECEDLWNDISNFCQNAENKDQYFLGSIVIYPKENTLREWYVVDGQQRLITLTLLIRALFANAAVMKILQQDMFLTDPQTGDPLIGELRLSTEVQAGANRDDAQNFKNTVTDPEKFANQKNKFMENYEFLKQKITDLWANEAAQDNQRFIEIFRTQVVLLPIECGSLDDALDLFQIINDRGLPLSDADIFKAKIYGAISSQPNKNAFIERWGKLDDHDFLFRLFMHVSRARQGRDQKEINIRKYVLDNHLNNQTSLPNEWDSIMQDLELGHFVWRETDFVCEGEINIADEKIYRTILSKFTNSYWQYIVFAFLSKYMKHNNDKSFRLPSEKQGEYLVLLRDTVRYFYIRGLVYNNVNRIRDTVYKVYVAIHGDGDYKTEYQRSITDHSDDLSAVEQRLDKCEYGRYRTGLVLLNSMPSEENDRKIYSEALGGTIHIEHILPRQWNNYDKWDKNSHERDIDKLGNLMPLERKLNIAASAEFFRRKQTEYAKSKIHDALVLSKKSPSEWYPEDVATRHKEVDDQLKQFFNEPFGTQPSL